MKKILPVLIVLFSASLSQAQVEVKLNPIAALFEVAWVGLEFGVSNSIGIDLNAVIGDGGGVGWVEGKYYFNPNRGLDKFYVNSFLQTGENIAGLGFGLGYKLVANSGLLFEVGGGIGRNFSDGGDGAAGYLKANVGYRF